MFCAWIIIAQNREIARANFAENGKSPLLFHPAADACNGLVVFHPVLHIHYGKLRGRVADDHLGNPGVDDISAAHGAGGGVVEQFAGGGVAPAEI